MTNATVQQIVRCLKRDIGNLQAAIKYAETISRNASMNPWSPSCDAPNYQDAAEILKRELNSNNGDNAK